MNRLLAGIPETEWLHLDGAFESVEHSLGQVLWQPGELIPRVHFPTAGILSAVVVMQDGGTVEGWLTGREGAGGLEAAFGLPNASWRMTVQADVTGLAIPPRVLREALSEMPVFAELLFRYGHTVQQQATVDRQEGRVHIQMTHEFLAQMLGAHRPSVTVTLATLERAGLIRRAGRGLIEVLDRAGLEDASCECYRATLTETDLIFS